jgi:hypothetical protein
MIYIQRKDDYQLETVDHVEPRIYGYYREAKRLLKEYQLSDPYANYYLSSRACKDYNSTDES